MRMNLYVAFIRAINVAGHARIKMATVRDAFTAAGCRKVRSYIQSGNVIFESSATESANLVEKVRTKLSSMYEDEWDIMLRPAPWIEELVGAAPFKNVENPSAVKLYVVFLSQQPGIRPRLPLVSRKDGLEVIALCGNEAFVVSRRKDNGFFGIPNNFVEKELGVTATSRNWSTIQRIARLLQTGTEKEASAPIIGSL